MRRYHSLLAFAGLVVIAACTDSGSKSITAPPKGPLNATTSSGGLVNGAHIYLCVSSTSPAGTYTFQNSHEDDGVAIGGGFDAGDGGFGTDVFNAANGVGYPVTPRAPGATGADGCVLVMQRTAADPAFVAGTQATDSYGGVTMTHISNNAGAVYSSTDCLEDVGVLPAQPSPCGANNNPTRAFANIVHGVMVTFNFTAAPQQVIPLFVIGDLVPHHTVGDVVNFWGSQWWKNNPMSNFSTSGWPSFKGYASGVDLTPSAGAPCGNWTSRVGNSPPPPETIPEFVGIIVTDRVYKIGPGEGGKIMEIVIVRSDGDYGPAPGHRGGGPIVSWVCGHNAP